MRPPIKFLDVLVDSIAFVSTLALVDDHYRESEIVPTFPRIGVIAATHTDTHVAILADK